MEPATISSLPRQASPNPAITSRRAGNRARPQTPLSRQPNPTAAPPLFRIAVGSSAAPAGQTPKVAPGSRATGTSTPSQADGNASAQSLRDKQLIRDWIESLPPSSRIDPFFGLAAAPPEVQAAYQRQVQEWMRETGGHWSLGGQSGSDAPRSPWMPGDPVHGTGTRPAWRPGDPVYGKH